MVKKKNLIKKKFSDYCKHLFFHRAKYLKYGCTLSYLIGRQMNINKQFKAVIESMRKNNILNENQLLPSIFKAYYMDGRIIPFWNDNIQQVSNKLFMPSNDNLKLINNNTKTFKSDSWFTVNQYVAEDKKYYKLKTKDHEQDIQEVVKCKKIKLFLNQEQKKYMCQIIGIYRYFYNRCVSYFNNYDKHTKTSWFHVDPKDEKTKILINNIEYPYNMRNMRPFLKDNLPKWILEKFPSHLIDETISEAFTRFQTCLSRCIKTRRPFDFKYKTKKQIVQTINLEKGMISYTYNGLFANWKINGKSMFKKIRSSEKFTDNVIGSSISYHRILGTFVLNMNYYATSTNIKSKQVCAIDQGIKKPYTIYSPSKVTEIGEGSADKLHKICKEMDIIISRMNSNKYYKKYKTKDDYMIKQFHYKNSANKRSLKKALHRKIKYIQNMVSELHNKTIKHLCDTYKTIILPPFKIQEMACNLHNKVARNMYTLSFYKFKQKLISKGKEKGVKIYSLNEPFTSKTCGRCGNIKYNLGNADVYRCDKCNLVISRDINGARNILLRNLHYI